MAFLASCGDHWYQMVKRRSKKGSGMPFSRLNKLSSDLEGAEERLQYKAGQVIFYEGHYPYGVYILRKGRVRLFTKAVDGEARLLKIVEPEQILGEEAYRSGRPFGYSAEAETDVAIGFVSRTAGRGEKGRDDDKTTHP